MTTSYNANKAATFNRLTQQGLSEDAAAAQAGISDAEFGNYAIGSNGQMGPIIAGTGTVTQAPTAEQQAESAAFDAGLRSDPNFERVDFAQTATSQPGPQRAQAEPEPVITNDSAGFDTVASPGNEAIAGFDFAPAVTEPEPVITNDSAGFDTVASPGNEAIAGFDFADGGPGNASIAGFDFVPGAVATAVGTRSAQQQNTLQNRVSMPASADWRVRLSLAQSASYLYRASNAGIMAPLARTNGVIFPYTPSIETQYQAKYSSVDLVHSNYKGFFYQGSSIESVAIRGTFTAQDTREAEYLLAVIVFFRSIVKMFYGATDPLAGTPPPLVFLSGLGQYQFNNNPCVVSGFNYSLPTDVDYIRANGFNNYGINLDNRRNPSSGPPASGILGAIASVNRLLNSNLVAGALTQRPAPGPVSQNNSNTNYTNSTYVPTKIDINLTLLPIQTRQQISSQFNLQNFANGQLLQQGYW